MFLSLTLSRFLGLIRDAIIAGKFGSNEFTDAYRLAFSVPDLLFFLIAGGALSSAFIPVFSEYLHTDREEEAWKVFSVVATLMSVVTLVFVVVAMIFSTQLAHIVAPGKPDSVIPLIAYMSRIVLPAQFAFFVGGLMFGTLYAKQIFAVPGLGPNVYNLGIIFGAVALSGLFTPGVVGMSWGALGGAIVGNLIIPGWAMMKIGAKYKFSLDYRHPGVKKVFKLMLPVVLGLSLPGVYALVMQAFGSYYHAGVNTVLEFSNKLMQAPLGIFGQSLAIGIFPTLTQFFAEKRMDAFRGQLAATMRTVMFMTIPISTLMAVMAIPISAAMYRHGQFTMDATVQVGECLQLFALGIPAWCLHPILMRGFFAIQDSKTPIILGTVTTVVFVGCVFTLRYTPLSYRALPLASSISAIFLVILLSLALRRRVGPLGSRGIVRTAAKSLLASVPVAVVGALVAHTPLERLIVGSKLAQLGGVGLVFIIAGWAFYLCARALKMPEAETITRGLNRATSRLNRAR